MCVVRHTQAETESFGSSEGFHADWADELAGLPTTAADNSFALFREDVVSDDTLALFVDGKGADEDVDPWSWFLPFNQDPVVMGNYL